MKFFNKLRNAIIYTLILSFVASPVLAGYYMQPVQPKYRFDMKYSSGAADQVGDGGTFAQTYAGTNKTNMGEDGLLDTIGANTVRINENGVLLEPAGTQLLFAPNTFTAAAGWTLANVTGPETADAIGPDGTTSAWTMVDASAAAIGYIRRAISKSAADSTTYFQGSVYLRKTVGATTFPGVGLTFSGGTGGDCYFTINTNTGIATGRSTNSAANRSVTILDKGLWWEVVMSATDNNSNTICYFYPAFPAVNADAGNTWDVATQGSCVIANGKLTTGAIPSSYFAGAAAIGAEVITDAHNQTFADTNEWANVDLGTAFNAATDLTITASAAGQYCTLPEANAPMTASLVYRIQFALANIVGSWTVGDFDGNVIGTAAANGTRVFYWICTATGGGLRLTAVTDTSSGDFDNFSAMEHGTVRTTEANSTTLAIPTAVSNALTEALGAEIATGTLTAGTLYKITADTGDDFYAGSAVDEYFTAAGTETCDADSKVKAITRQSKGTLVAWVYPGYAEASTSTDSEWFSTTTGASLLGHDVSGNGIKSNDGTIEAVEDIAFTANTRYKMVLRWGEINSNINQFWVSVDDGAAGVITNGTKVTYDGAFAATTTILGQILYAPVNIGPVWIFPDEILTDSYIDNNM